MEQSEVLLSIIGKQTLLNGEISEMSFYTSGMLKRDMDGFVLEYDESEISGMDGTRTSLIASNGRVVLERSGYASAMMVFERGVRSINLYSAGTENMHMELLPSRVEYGLDGNQGAVTLEYQIEMPGQFSTTNLIQLTFREQ